MTATRRCAQQEVHRVEKYGEAALARACAAIAAAPNSVQAKTLHAECYAIGGLVAGRIVEEGEAKGRLIAAARAMPVYREKWTGLERKVESSLKRGMASPRTPPSTAESNAKATRAVIAKSDPPRSGATTSIADALALFRDAVDPRGTPAERYFRERRGLDLPDDLCGPVLRWHAGERAVVALFRNIATGAGRDPHLPRP
jgi:hypothetical protein